MKKNIRTNIIWVLILISCIGLVLYLQANNKIKENKVQRISQDEEESGKEIIKTKEEVEKQYLEEKEISPYMVFEQNKDKIQAVKYLERNKLTDLSEFTEEIKKGKIGLINEIKIKNYKTYKKDGQIYIEYILEKTTIPRIRISSLWPEFIDEKCLEIFKNKRIYPHFHYSVQSGSSSVLKDMRRHYDWKYMRDLLEKTKNLKREDWVEVSIWADIIVWFPGETEKDFLETYNLVKDWLITKVHAFPFSPHKFWESVPAGNFENQVWDKEKKERMWELEAIADSVRDDFIDRNIWKRFEVLIEVVKEEDWKTRWKGWTENYIEADDKTFDILEWEIAKNNIVIGILK